MATIKLPLARWTTTRYLLLSAQVPSCPGVDLTANVYVVGQAARGCAVDQAETPRPAHFSPFLLSAGPSNRNPRRWTPEK